MEQRFWSKVNKTDTCWLWTGCINSQTGYGSFAVKRITKNAHRVSWLLSGNTIPEGFILCHAPHEICGNRHCVNPAHLRVGTIAENVNDQISDGTIARGIKHGSNKLTEDQVRAIRANPENKSQGGLAREYGVSSTHIRRVISRKKWAWLV